MENRKIISAPSSTQKKIKRTSDSDKWVTKRFTFTVSVLTSANIATIINRTIDKTVVNCFFHNDPPYFLLFYKQTYDY